MSLPVPSSTEHATLLFDGVCNFCNGSVLFVLRRDERAFFKFASLQSDAGKALMAAQGVPEQNLSTLILLENGRCYLRSSAMLRVARRLGPGWWLLGTLGLLVPAFLRDWLYSALTKHRYRWFGRTEQCMVPTPEVRSRFLEITG